MKLSSLLLTITILQAFASGSYSQATELSLDLRDATVEQVLLEIENRSEFYFLFNDQLVDIDRKVSISVENQKIETILTNIFLNTGVDFIVLDRQIVLSPSEYLTEVKSILEPKTVSGQVLDQNGEPLAGVSIVVKRTGQGVISDVTGHYSISDVSAEDVLVFSFVGMLTEEIVVGEQSIIDVTMAVDVIGIEEVVAIGYGVQKKSDITGTVASLSKERLDMVPNLNIAQAIQGSISGVMIQTSTAGAASDEVIMIRGRNSITASNTPLIVLDGIPYSGAIRDINPNDIQSIEVLKDASAAAIYGSRGANGVVLITSIEGRKGKPTIAYDGKVASMNYTSLPDVMNGEEFYDFKVQRGGLDGITASEQEVYDAGEGLDWIDIVTRKGLSHQHNLSVSGGTENTTYYISGSFLDVRGIRLNDDYLRTTGRLNVESKITDWFTIGTRTQLTYDDRSGVPVTSNVIETNPLVTLYDDDGKLTIYPWPEDTYFGNPLQVTLWNDIDKSYQVQTNNYAIIDFPFIKGLSYRLNTGVRVRFTDEATYRARDGKIGLEAGGESSTNRGLYNNTVIENILSYNNAFGKHNIFATGVYSYEENKYTSHGLNASKYPHDFLKWYSAGQAEILNPHYSYTNTVLISQMLRLSYNYDSRYLLTATGRRDGFSGFGANTKWGIFPSVALGWNLVNESFFPLGDLFSQFKLRISWGLNGNQAISAYQTITRLGSADGISGGNTTVGYIPNNIGMDDLGWESSETMNIGLDFGFLENRITGDLNLYRTITSDLLLERTISPVSGFTGITQNIGKTENKGIELSINSRNIVSGDFTWSTSGNLAGLKNEILALYGLLDDEGNEIDDISNWWFIGQPIRVNYNYVRDGIWQLDESEEAAKWGSKPGWVKLKDLNGDYVMDPDNDRQIQGQRDPKLLWGLTNSFSYKNFRLDVFIHGVHGVTKNNTLMQDAVWGDEARRNTTNKDRWSPENPDGVFYINEPLAQSQGGVGTVWLENASFVRIKDLTLSYDVPESIISSYGFDRIRLYVTGRNLLTLTKWSGLDPELDNQYYIPLQREIVFGLNVGF